nr:hypothetical protein CFP56_03193 [Quercus suber]
MGYHDVHECRPGDLTSCSLSQLYSRGADIPRRSRIEDNGNSWRHESTLSLVKVIDSSQSVNRGRLDGQNLESQLCRWPKTFPNNRALLSLASTGIDWRTGDDQRRIKRKLCCTAFACNVVSTAAQGVTSQTRAGISTRRAAISPSWCQLWHGQYIRYIANTIACQGSL